MARHIAEMEQRVAFLEGADAQVKGLEEANRQLTALEASARQEAVAARQEAVDLKASLARAEEQLRLRGQQLQEMEEEKQQHLAQATKLKEEFAEMVKMMEENPAPNVVEKVVASYKADPHTYEEIQIILAPALRRGYTLGVDEAKPADLVIKNLPNHKLYDTKAAEVFTKRFDEYKAGEDIVGKYSKKKVAQPPVPSTAQPSAPSTS